VIHVKAATVAARKCGERPSFKTPRYRGKAKSIYKANSSAMPAASNARLDYWRSNHRECKEQLWKLSTICDSTHGRLFVCHYIAENRLLQFL
jgi:hypothetical protein